MSNKLVSVVIANFNGEKYLDTCLRSLLKSSYQKIEVVIVDDGSSDQSENIIDKCRDEDKRVILLKNKDNLGAAASRNIAIREVKGEVVVFLDNDTEIEKNTIHELVKTVGKKGIGASQALILDFKKRDSVQMAGGILIPQVGWIIPLYQGASYKKIKNDLKEKDIVAISAALAVEKEVLEKIKGFDPEEAVYTEDLDLSWRIWISGYRVVLSPKALVYHYTKSVKDRAGMKANYRQIYFHLAKNSMRSITKNFEFFNVVKYLPLSLVINLGRGLVFLISRKESAAFFGSMHALWWYLQHFMDTLSERRKVNAYRKFNDDKLIKLVFAEKNLVEIYRGYYLRGNIFT